MTAYAFFTLQISSTVYKCTNILNVSIVNFAMIN